MRLLLFALLLFLLDQATKSFVSESLPLFGTGGLTYPYGGIPLFQGLFGVEGSIVYAANRGAAWGILQELPTLLLVLRILLAVGLLFLLFYKRGPESLRPFPLTLILAGALGNIWDSLTRGEVVDLFYFNILGYPYPVFNVADIAITLGVSLLILPSRREACSSP